MLGAMEVVEEGGGDDGDVAVCVDPRTVLFSAGVSGMTAGVQAGRSAVTVINAPCGWRLLNIPGVHTKYRLHPKPDREGQTQ